MNKKLDIRGMCFIGIFAAVTAILAQIIIPLPFTPVPVSFGILAVYITGILLNPKYALLSQVIYLLLGMAGAPVFGGFRGGFSVLAGPTGGYLIACPIMAFIISYFIYSYEKKGKGNTQKLFYKKIIRTLLGLIIAQLVCYIIGTIWLSILSNISFVQGLIVAVYPFIIADLIKMVIAIFFILPIRKRLNIFVSENTR
ncbi:hypothetical protein AZF37_04955 [endosymbiont 'TC1' of Trimyema compressum]|uniref:biotin transporter BioY n=1 Tax=endosymbiont 'TC1' of Trimyema compressum TaxID=243899 RepID=UPI0007F06508|nr:biotin transporter BioY [endosymbiont 'TC1' of Trimyema compressum]AMP20608.1 hypothetical protein AZF37_04955 [endosymbiont 'TC1' of Trimyema compressum]